jgi:alkyl sulfatase BDS1-like metallo-beta-lactamase superfamily hydrolase
VSEPRAIATASLLSALLLIWACGEGPSKAEPKGQVHPTLAAHDEEFERKLYEVTDGVHVAVGFGIANSILVEGDECAFVVDAMGSVESARAVKAEFDAITSKPIEAIIYTHNHGDHVFGARGLAPDGDVDVYAHETTSYYINRVVNVIRPVLSERSARMFGAALPSEGPDRLINVGIGPFLEVTQAESTNGLIRPNKTFADELDLTLCGVRVRLVHAPGETNDQLFVWLPEQRVLMPGDNVYKAFPNLYTIRGTLYRDVLGWVQSLDRMRALQAEHLVPSHTRPVSGKREIAEILTAYRDGIQFVHDQTIRGINRGLTPDELVEVVVLPPHLKNHPYLQELYGTVEWSVRAVYSGYLGWFNGDTATLSPAGPAERAAGFAELAGGVEGLLDTARAAVAEKRYAWAAELATQLMRVDPGLEEARLLKARALRELGRRSISPNGRNYYLTQALELEGAVELEIDFNPENALALIHTIPIGDFVAAMPANLDPEKSESTNLIVGFRFPDVDEGYMIHVRRGVAEFQPEFPDAPDLVITADSGVWKEVVIGLRNPAMAFASGAVEVDGSALDLVGFLRLFR